MAETLATIRATVSDMISRTDLDDQIDASIQRAISYLVRKGGDYLEQGEGTITAVADQQWYSTVDFTSGYGAETFTATTNVGDILLIQSMKITPGSGGIDNIITEVDFETFEVLSNGNEVGAWPTHYTVHGERIGLWPTPNSAYTVEVAAMVRPVNPSADSDASPIMDRMSELLELAAAKRVAANYMHDDEMAMKFAAQEGPVWSDISAEMIRRSSAGRIRPRG